MLMDSDEFGFGNDYAANIGIDAGRLVSALSYKSGHGVPLDTGFTEYARGAVSPTADQEIAFVSGINLDGTINDTSYWGFNDQTAYKWGASTAGTGATISYSFDAASRFSDLEKSTFLKAFAMWSSVADVTFVEVGRNAGVVLKRGFDDGAYTSAPTSNGSGAALGSLTGQALISIDTSVPGFDLSGSYDRSAGYGLSTIIHEVGHLLGLGHGGFYNGAATPRTDQFSAFDDRMFTIMSYISWTDNDAKFGAQNPIVGTNWGSSRDGSIRSAPHTIMAFDIVAIQQLYGVAQDTPFDGGQTYGFHSNITGVLGDSFDFSINSSPVVTIFNTGHGNTIDLSEYAMGGLIDLRPGAFSSVGGLVNNLCIDFSTDIETAICGAGNDTLVANDIRGVLIAGGGNDLLIGGLGRDLLQGDGGADTLFGFTNRDVMIGGSGGDVFRFTATSDSGKTSAKADEIVDFTRLEGDRIDLSGIDAIRGRGDDAFRFIGTGAFSTRGGELRYEVIGGDAFVSGDVTGDGRADFLIRLDDVTSVIASDFFL